MVIKLTAIKDPGLAAKDGENGTPISPQINKQMTLRKLVLKQQKNNKIEDMTVRPSPPVQKQFLSTLPKVVSKDFKIECQTICERALEAIESVDQNNHFCIGKGANRMYCGSVIHRIPMGGFARIGGGQCVYLETPPLNKDGTFKYESDRQLAVKVNNKVGTDFLVAVAQNGCIFIDAGAWVAFNMPVFVVEQSGEYYKLEKGQRIVSLMSGNHMLIYTYEAPILFPKVAYRPKRMIKSVTASPAIQKLLEKTKSDEKKSIEKTPKKEKPEKEVPKKEEPKKEKSKDDLDESKSKEDTKADIKEDVQKKEDSKEDIKEESNEKKKEEEPKKKEPVPFSAPLNDSLKSAPILDESKSKEDTKVVIKEDEQKKKKKEWKVVESKIKTTPKEKEESKEDLKEESNEKKKKDEPKVDDPKKKEPVPFSAPLNDSLKASAVDSVQEVAPADGQGGRNNAKVIGLVAAIAVGLLVLYLLFSGSKSDHNNHHKHPKK